MSFTRDDKSYERDICIPHLNNSLNKAFVPGQLNFRFSCHFHIFNHKSIPLRIKHLFEAYEKMSKRCNQMINSKNKK